MISKNFSPFLVMNIYSEWRNDIRGGQQTLIHVPPITANTSNMSTLTCLYAVGYKTSYFLRGAEQYRGARGAGVVTPLFKKTLYSKDERFMRPATAHIISETSLMQIILRVLIFWDMALCCLVENNRRFGGMYYLLIALLAG
jgi:hypothetical protein